MAQTQEIIVFIPLSERISKMINKYLLQFSLRSLFFLPLYLQALPDQREVTKGNVTFEEIGKKLEITASDGAVISYSNGFNIGADETVRFLQPSSNARVLNQIYGSSPSEINGQLIANGAVYLVNEAGVIFGQSAVVEVGKLQAIAGTFSVDDFTAKIDNYSSLTGSVENLGSILAEEIVLAGSSVTNSGTILSENGFVVLSAGGSLQLVSQNSEVSVTLSQQFQSPPGGASDIAGQAVIQSGVIEASLIDIRGNAITNSGKIEGDLVRVADFSNFSSDQGSLVAKELSLSGLSSGTVTANLSSSANQISKVEVNENFESISVRSSSSMVVGTELNPKNFSANFVDMRVTGGDLTMNSKPSPLSSGLQNTILLAAEHNLNIAYNVDGLSYARLILFGRNLTPAAFQKIEPKPSNLVQLYANTISLDELTFDFTPALLRKIAAENPTFSGFSLEGSGGSQNTAQAAQVNPLLVSSAPEIRTGLSTVPFNNLVIPGDEPSFSPRSLSEPYSTDISSLLSDNLINTAMEYKFFNNYSYYLTAADLREVSKGEVFDVLSKRGGSSAFFGGSFDVVSSSESNDEGSGSSNDSDSSGENSDGGTQQRNAVLAAATRTIQGAIPFSPISMPIFSPEAGVLLNDALSPSIELRLEKYLNR